MYLPRTLALFDEKTATWAGRSGRRYDFVVSRPGTAWIDEPAVYILVKRKGGSSEPLFVGHTENLRSRLGSSATRCPEEWRRALMYGMTQVHLRFDACTERARRAETVDLLAALNPVINEELARQACQPAHPAEPARSEPARSLAAAIGNDDVPLKLVVATRGRTRHAEDGKIAFPVAPARADAHAPEPIDMDPTRLAAVEADLGRFFRRDPSRGLDDDELFAPSLWQGDAAAPLSAPTLVAGEAAISIDDAVQGVSATSSGRATEIELEALPTTGTVEALDGAENLQLVPAESTALLPEPPATESQGAPDRTAGPDVEPAAASSPGLLGRMLRLFSWCPRLRWRTLVSDAAPPVPVQDTFESRSEGQISEPSSVASVDVAFHAPAEHAFDQRVPESAAPSPSADGEPRHAAAVELCVPALREIEQPADSANRLASEPAEPAPLASVDSISDRTAADSDRLLPPDGRRELGLDEATPVVLFSGDLSYHAGADILMDAAATVCATNADVQFIFVGDGELAGDLRDRAARAAMQDRCRFLGDVPAGRFPVVLAACDFVVIPARTKQGEPLARMALDFGKPVLVTVQAGIACVVHGQNGLVTYDNPHSFVWGIRALLGPIRNDLCKRMMKAA